MSLLFLELLVLACVVVVAVGQPGVCKDGEDCEAHLTPPGNGVFTSDVQLSDKLSHRRERLFRTFEGVHHVVDCEAVTLFNTTDGSVLYGPMAQMEGREAVNHRLGWEDGRGRYLFFMPRSGADTDSFHGTWLVGDRLGVDSGTLFLKPKHAVMVPVSSGADPASSAGLAHLGSWKVLTEGKWAVATEVEARCTGAMERGAVYSGQYYEDDASSSGAPQNGLVDTVLVQIVKASSSGLQVPRMDLAIGPLLGAIPSDASSYLHLDVHRGGWLPLVSTLDPDKTVGLGEVFFLRSVNTNAPACVGTPVNFEWLEKGFRVFFHCTDATIASERYGYFDENGFMPTAELTADETDDITVELLEREPRRLEREASCATLDGARAGDLIWLFYRELDSGDPTPRELLLECMVDSPRGNVSLFRYYESDRRQVMRRTHVSRATAMVQYHPATDQLFLDLGLGHSETSTSLHSPRVREVEAVSVSPLGADAVGWLKGFLARTEGLFGGLPSCFLYHGAIGMPKPLVYAAELLCVLIGAKFPLMQQLIQASVLAATTLGGMRDPTPNGGGSFALLDLAFSINSYQGDETLIIYRRDAKRMVAALRPIGQAQALHIAPYTNTDPRPPNEVGEEQVINSYWNGYLLGYPISFVSLYTNTITSALGPGEVNDCKARAMTQLKEWERDANDGDTMPRIGMGSFADISKDVLAFMPRKHSTL